MLNPKKYNEFYKLVSEELEIPESDVQDIIFSYWSAVRKKMESLEEPYILIENLGTFYVKSKNLKQQILKNEMYVKQHNPKDFKKYAMFKNTSARLEQLNKLFDKVMTERDRKTEHKNNRKNGTESNRDMEAPGKDS
jgi:nucleoid DNA-binding protein